MVHYKLEYFPVRGRGESIRYIFHHAGVAFEEKTVKLADWPKRKEKVPFGILPIIYIDDKPLGESVAICAYLGREFGLAGADTYEAAQCEMLGMKLDSLFWTKFAGAVVPPLFADDVELAATNYDDQMSSTIPEFLKMFEQLLKHNGGHWLIGSKVTWIDLSLAHVTEGLTSTFDSKILDKYPKLKAHAVRVHKLPKIKKYVEKRTTQFVPVDKLQKHLKLPK